MDDESRSLEDLAEDVLEGRRVDWESAKSSPDSGPRDTLEQLKVLAGIAGLHRSLAFETAASEPLESWGRLRILERIGQGSFGDVYRAWDTKLDREVALKLLRPDAQPERGAEVLKEARLLARVRHPNVAVVYDADEVDGRVGLWMEFIHGKNLEEILAEKKRLDEREVTRIGVDLCRALSAVHAAGLLHRDIKAQNVMQAEDGRVVLMDFGTGSDLESSSGVTDAAGTPLYLAPEIFGGSAATVRSDLYSVGVLLFHLTTGAYPVRGSSLREIEAAHAQGETSSFRARASKPLASVITRAIVSDPAKRFGSAKEMVCALDDVRRRVERPRRAVLIAAGFALAILLVTAVAWLSRTDRAASQAAPFKPRDWVLVSRFENRTAEKVLDGTLDYALGLELANSRYVNVVSRQRIDDALRLMRKPPDTAIDAATAREVCLRDGGIRRLLAGRVEKIGSKYVLSVELVDPATGTALAGFREESTGPDGALAAVAHVSNRIRTALGESPSPVSTEALAKVTTSSLKALQLYSRADSLLVDERFVDEPGQRQQIAEGLLREAVAEDPTFASAWILLAFTLSNQNKSPDEIRSCAETALRLSDATTDRERYFIRGSYLALLQQGDRGRADYEALVSLYPDHYWAASNLIFAIYDWRHNADELAKSMLLEARLADSRPNDFGWNWNAWITAVTVRPDSVRAARFFSRASKLITPEIRERLPDEVASIELASFFDNYVAGKLVEASAVLDRADSRIDSFGGRLKDSVAVQIAVADMSLGRLRAATQTAAKIGDRAIESATLAQIAFLRGDDEELRRELSLLKEQPDGSATLDAHGVLAAIAISDGQHAVAVHELQEEWNRFQNSVWFPPVFFLSSESLARILTERGDVPGAIRVLELPKRYYQATNLSTAAYWLRNRLQLARLYRRMGRVEDAREVEAELRRLLSVADADHPILAELRRMPT